MSLKDGLKNVKSFEAWMKANFDKDTLKDIADHGADSGWPNLTYYTDTVTLYEHFKDDIWDMLVEDAEDMGYNTPYELMQSFGGSKNVSSYTTHANLMTWYAAERNSQRLTSFTQNLEQEDQSKDKGWER